VIGNVSDWDEQLCTNESAEMLSMVRGFRSSRIRTMRQFAEEEIYIPDGVYEGLKFRCDRQPWTKLWFDEVDSGQYTEIATTGARQGGKTLVCLTIPILYHLFELKETVILGAPLDEHVSNKWSIIIKPMIMRTRFRDLIPTIGAGARGGSSNLDTIKFDNGAVLKFMTSGGDDKSRVSFTSRVLAVTEVDGFDKIGGTSVESTKLVQMEGCTASYDLRARKYYECTTSVEKGKIWQAYMNGTRSYLFMPCMKCGQFVTIERDNLHGWQEATSEQEAQDKSFFACPKCGKPWTEREWRTSNKSMTLVHHGQSIDSNGNVTGERRQVSTLGFRWHVGHNMFKTPASIGLAEYKASRAKRGDEGELEMRQFFWSLPAIPEAEDLYQLSSEVLKRRIAGTPEREASDEMESITVGVDVQKRRLFWVAIGWFKGGRGTIIEYRSEPCDIDSYSEEDAITNALVALRGRLEDGFWSANEGEFRKPEYVFIDCGNWMNVICNFVRTCIPIRSGCYYAVRGCGTMREYGKTYTPAPANPGKKAQTYVGQCMHAVRYPNGSDVIEVDADYWKGWMFSRLASPTDSASPLLFYKPEAGRGHTIICDHFCAEERQAKYVEGKGIIVSWVRVSRQNHYLDAAYYACAASWPAKIRLSGEAEAPARKAEPEADKTVVDTSLERPDGRQWHEIGRRAAK